MTDSQITKQTPFHERIYDRIREQLGELLTAEEAQKLVERAIEEGLFKERQVSTGQWSSRTETLPSPFVEMVTKQVAPLVEKAIQKWIAENPQQVERVIQEVLGDGILRAAYQALMSRLVEPTYKLQNDLMQVINKIGGIQ